MPGTFPGRYDVVLGAELLGEAFHQLAAKAIVSLLPARLDPAPVVRDDQFKHPAGLARDPDVSRGIAVERMLDGVRDELVDDDRNRSGLVGARRDVVDFAFDEDFL